MRKFLAIICAVALFMTGISDVSAEKDDIKVTLNGNEIEFDVPPQIINNRTMVPLRAVFEAMGAYVSWWEWENGGYISVELNGKSINCGIGENSLRVDATDIQIDSPPCIIDGRTLVPVRAISESLGADVNWNEATKTVEIAYQPIYPLPLNSEQISSIFGQWYSIPCFEKETLANKDFAFNFIFMWELYREYPIVRIPGVRWGSEELHGDAVYEWILLDDKDTFNERYKLFFGCDMPYFTEDDLPYNMTMFDGKYAVAIYRNDFGEPGDWIYNHAELKPDGSYDISFLYCSDTYDEDGTPVGEYRLWNTNDIFNISLVDNGNGFIINSHRYYEKGVLQPLEY